MTVRVYLAGPMTGLQEMNYPAFHAEAARLRALGLRVENPAENPEQPSWRDYMRKAIAQLVTCEVIALLPGWENSRGAVMEQDIAQNLGMRCVLASDIKQPSPRSNCWICSGAGVFAGEPCPCVEVKP